MRLKLIFDMHLFYMIINNISYNYYLSILNLIKIRKCKVFS